MGVSSRILVTSHEYYYTTTHIDCDTSKTVTMATALPSSKASHTLYTYIIIFTI